MFFPGLILLFVWFIPESPRWLYVNNRIERARGVLTKWHGYGNPDSAWVKLQVAEYEEYLNLNGAVSLLLSVTNLHAVVGALTISNRINDSGTIVRSSVAAPAATALPVTASSPSLGNGPAMEH